MLGHMTGSQFAWKIALRIGIFLVFTLGFPFIIYGVVLATGAQRVSGASGAMAVVVGMVLKPVIIVAFLIAMISPSWKRTRSLGIAPLWGLLVPLLLAMDYTYLFVVGNFWGATFSLGILSVQAPLYAITALVLIVAMAIAAPPSNDEPRGLLRFGAAGQAFTVLAIAVSVVGLVTLVYSAWTYGMILSGRVAEWIAFNRSISTYIFLFWKAKPFLCLTLSALALWLALVSRRSSGGKASTPPGLPGEPSAAHAAFDSSPQVFGKR